MDLINKITREFEERAILNEENLDGIANIYNFLLLNIDIIKDKKFESLRNLIKMKGMGMLKEINELNIPEKEKIYFTLVVIKLINSL